MQKLKLQKYGQKCVLPSDETLLSLYGKNAILLSCSLFGTQLKSAGFNEENLPSRSSSINGFLDSVCGGVVGTEPASYDAILVSVG